MSAGSPETRQRFLRAIGAQVPAASIVEIHFFQPIRQGGVESGVAVVVESAGIDPRHVVHTAWYRLVLKGPDRGKWETNVVAEADAPLVTVDAVVRGVQRRSGDVDDPERLEGDAVRAQLAALEPAVAPAGP
jgi:hypothetical protein